jgi:hypothetical protein
MHPALRIFALCCQVGARSQGQTSEGLWAWIRMPLLFDGAIEVRLDVKGSRFSSTERLRGGSTLKGSGIPTRCAGGAYVGCGCGCWSGLGLGGGQMISPSPGGLGSKKVLEQNLRR